MGGADIAMVTSPQQLDLAQKAPPSGVSSIAWVVQEFHQGFKHVPNVVGAIYQHTSARHTAISHSQTYTHTHMH